MIIALLIFAAFKFTAANGDEYLDAVKSNHRRLGIFSWLGFGDSDTETIKPATVQEEAQLELQPLPVVVADKKYAGLAAGKKVALLQVHFEGNVGDQMETLPLLMKLKAWGVKTDCYLSLWMPSQKRLDPEVHKRVASYVENIYQDGIGYDSNVVSRNYDMLVVSPGPTVNELSHCIHKPAPKGTPVDKLENITIAWFGVSITGWAQNTYTRGQKHCVKLIAAREELSLKRAKSMLEPGRQVDLLMSGDISFSYPYDKHNPVILGFVDKFIDSLKTYHKPDWAHTGSKAVGTENNDLEGRDWVMIFSRENNFGADKGIWITNGTVFVRSIEKTILQYPIKKVVFASSSRLEDTKHLKLLQRRHDIHHSRALFCSSVEELFAFVSSAPHVITDRYHPGVAAKIVGTKLTITFYKSETTKMTGLHYMKQFSHDEILRMNEKAFDKLFDLLISEKRDTSYDPVKEPRYRLKPWQSAVEEFLKNKEARVGGEDEEVGLGSG